MNLPLRTQIRDALLRTAVPALHAFADAIIARDGERMACWGNLADHVLEHIPRDDDRIALWRVLLDVADPKPLLVFFDLNRDRPAVLRAVVDDVERLPPALQRALITMPEVEPLLELALPHLGPSALELVAAGIDAQTRDRAVYEAHMSALRAQRAASPCPINFDIVLTEASEALTSGDLP